MELTLGRRADYSLRAVLHLARHSDDQFRSSPTIAVAMDIPATWLPELLTTLVAARILESRGGRSGGYRLALPAREVTLLAVIDAVEPDHDATCVLLGGSCDRDEPCPFHEPWSDAKDALRNRLATTSFADMMANAITREL